MVKKKQDSIKDALTLGTKRTTPKKTNKNISEIEKATANIHEETITPTTKQEEKKYKEEVKKTSLHIPLDLYVKLKTEAFNRNVTLRKLIINALNEKFK